MNAVRFLTDELRQRFEVGGDQLRERAVAKDLPHKGIADRQILQHVRSGRVARFRLLARRHPQLLEKDMSELFGRIDIEWFPCLSVDILHEEAQLTLHVRLDLLPALLVCRDAGLLHRGKHLDERLFHVREKCHHSIFLELAAARPIDLRQEISDETALVCEIFHLIRKDFGHSIEPCHVR